MVRNLEIRSVKDFADIEFYIRSHSSASTANVATGKFGRCCRKEVDVARRQ